MAVTIQNKEGKTIHTSQNLRGLLEHMRRESVMEIHIRRLEMGGGGILVLFNNGDSCSTEFSSYRVLRHWVISRKWFQGVPLWVQGSRSGEVNPRHTFLSK